MENQYDPIINDWLAANPMSAHYLGIHDYDGQLPDMSNEGRTKTVEMMKTYLGSLNSQDPPIEKIETNDKMITVRNTNIRLFKMKFSINTIPHRKIIVGRHIRINEVIYGIILKGLTANDN